MAVAASNDRMLIIHDRKKNTRQMCHLLVFKYGSLNSNCGTHPHRQQPKETFFLLYFGAHRSFLPLWECADGMHVFSINKIL